MKRKILEEQESVLEESGKILRQSLTCLLDEWPKDLKIQLNIKRLAEELNDLMTVQSQGDNAVMGLFDVNLNQYVTINVFLS